jgi:hypothetical protein
MNFEERSKKSYHVKLDETSIGGALVGVIAFLLLPPYFGLAAWLIFQIGNFIDENISTYLAVIAAVWAFCLAVVGFVVLVIKLAELCARWRQAKNLG